MKRTIKKCLASTVCAAMLLNAVPMTVFGEESAQEKEMLTIGTEKYADRAAVAMDLAGKDGAETYVTASDAEGNEYTSGVYMSWRSYEADFDSNHDLTTTFTVYKNGQVLAENLKVTNLIDPAGTAADTYKVVGSNDEALGLAAKEITPWANKYLELSLSIPEDQHMPDGTTASYTANDMSLGDLDGDGVLDLIVKWYPTNAQDNSKSGYTGTTILDGYKVDYSTGDAELLWRIDMGINIRSGAHYTQFQVWDYDGDGKAEIAVRTSEGTTTYKSKDGTAADMIETGHVGEYNASQLPTDKITTGHDFRNSGGYIFNEPEKFTIFNGDDGTIIDTVDYTPGRGTYNWGDSYGNRSERYLSATAYLNGKTPFAVFCRGYYTRTALTAYYLADTDSDGIGDKIETYWAFDTVNEENASSLEAQGNHGLSVNDVDGDGKDEIIYGALTINDDGTVLYNTGLGHGDAMHVSDWVSWHDGLEVMSVHEHDNAAYHVEVHDAATGEILMGYYVGKDTGRGVAADIDPTAEGGEWWSIASPTYEDNDEPAWNSTKGEVYSSWSTLDNLIKLSDSTPACNASIFWDGDLLAEIQDGTFNSGDYVPIGTGIYKWDYENEKSVPLLYSGEIFTNNGTKQNVGIIADFLGDWREEIITRSAINASKVRIYSTTIETDYVVPCLLEDLAYREGVAWQNVAYNQPANTSYLISQGAVTAQLREGDLTQVTTSANVLDFTAANDGDLYGLDITAYNIYRAAANEEFALIDTVSVDKLVSTKEDGTTVYTYVDADERLQADTEYSYKVAAVVATPKGDSAESHMSRPVTLKTAIAINAAPTIEKITLVQDTRIESGQTVADLLPATLKVTAADGKEYDVSVTWDVSKVDITTVGEYTADASVRGWKEPITVSVEVVANGFDKYEAITITTLVGVTPALPDTVTVCYANATTEVRKVTWDTSALDVSKAGTVTVKGTVEGMEEAAEATIQVKENYITSVAVSYAEVEFDSVNVAEQLPATVSATWADNTTTKVAVTWDVTPINVSKAGTYTITGTVEEDCEAEIVAKVTVTYPLVARFDFGISASNTVEGWTPITVNPKKGSATASSLGIQYTQDKGYGFVNGDAVIAGRSEAYTVEGSIPAAVYQDFVLPAGQTFVVDVENGIYIVELLSGTSSGSDGLKSVIEGTALNVSQRKNNYGTNSVSVEVTDGQLTCDFPSGTSRMNAMTIRRVVAVPADKTALKAEIEAAKAIDGAQYTEESFAEFQLALKKATDTANAVGVSQEDVDAALTALQAAVKALVKVGTADKTALKAEIETAEAIDGTLYTEESFTALKTALAGATAVANKADATQEEVDAALAALQAAVKALVISVNFADVEEGWKNTAVSYVYQKGIMVGTNKDENGAVIFSPDSPLKREQFVQILFAAEGKQAVATEKTFSDLVEGAWYVDAVLWAAEKDIVSGVGGGKFGVDQNITREQLALMLYKYADMKGYDVTASQELDTFIDAEEVSSWAEVQLKWAVANGVMSGQTASDGVSRKLNPKGSATRAECAAMLRSFLLKFVDVETNAE